MGWQFLWVKIEVSWLQNPKNLLNYIDCWTWEKFSNHSWTCECVVEFASLYFLTGIDRFPITINNVINIWNSLSVCRYFIIIQTKINSSAILGKYITPKHPSFRQLKTFEANKIILFSQQKCIVRTVLLGVTKNGQTCLAQPPSESYWKGLSTYILRSCPLSNNW